MDKHLLSLLPDIEWYKAETSNQKPRYYYISYDNGCRTYHFIKMYKPAVAELVKKRMKWNLIEHTNTYIKEKKL